jgi:hypothetical protein
MRLVVGLVVGVLIGFGAATWFYGNGGKLIILGTEWGASLRATAEGRTAPGFTSAPPGGSTTFSTGPVEPDRSGWLFVIVWPKR